MFLKKYAVSKYIGGVKRVTKLAAHSKAFASLICVNEKIAAKEQYVKNNVTSIDFNKNI